MYTIHISTKNFKILGILIILYLQNDFDTNYLQITLNTVLEGAFIFLIWSLFIF